ncbi:hypothetical protein C3B44_03380 [Corynebacterium yudongzhengii]|uniref:Peptidase S1 domain-containing protein n=1 Tax=Corynebacterium yudongzhengii TaxID=2080740 RepID=A0A2U1T7D0_9CORY|nr:trypsin-like serine protease [Corynebacterium yudongzhengii]AWB81513.1 hypothetical protein C3B44_03380 [Corynebacterium yudongzhengii]PWC01916.1 hypothetical protein DF222_04865 [Corynebacterium yudongzhengii]
MPKTRENIAWGAAIVIAGLGVVGVTAVGLDAEQPEPRADATAPSVAANENIQRAEPEPELTPAPEVDEEPVAAVTPVSSPWAPGATFSLLEEYPEPGVPFTATECTAAFSFTGADGRMYAVTASHCGSQGDLVFPRNGETIADYTTEMGHVIYSGLDHPGAGEHDVRPDVAIIEITRPDSLAIAGGEEPAPTVLASQTEPGGTACKLGGTTGRTCGELGTQGEHYIMVDPATEEDVRSIGDTAAICAQRGDSGGPVIAEIDGRQAVIGLVSGTRSDEINGDPSCPGDGIDSAAGSIAFANIAQIKAVIDEVVPDAEFTPVA